MKSPPLDALLTFMYQTDVQSMSGGVFGEDYSEVKKVIYPHPPYRAFLLKKRGGGNRLIEEPKRRVKVLQLKALEFMAQFASKERPCVHGFTKDRSIVTNALAHWQRRPAFVLNIDLKDFFPSITFFRVRGLLQKPPFSFSYEVATVFAHLCTRDGKLPQGAPTSPFLSNLICRSLDRDLMELAKRHRCTYTRYADDMTFSFSVRSAVNLPSSICSFDGGAASLGEELRLLIKKHSFEVNERKTRISSRHSRQEVTGLTINQFPNVPRQFIDSVRGALNAWDVHGYEAAEQGWQDRVKKTAGQALKEMAWPRQTRAGTPPQLRNVLWGKLLYIRMVRSERDPLYNRLAQKFNDLVAREKAKNPGFRVAGLPILWEVHRSEQVAKAVYVVNWMGDAQIPGRSPGETEVAGSQGTAFAYRRNDMLITCEHVLRSELEAGGMADVSLIPGVEFTATNVASGFESKVTVVARDQDRDVAVLRIDTPKPGLRHFVRGSAPAAVGMAARLIGFPNWSAGRPANVESTTVTNVYPKKGLAKFEVGNLIRKGNSGGPITSEAFELLGVAQEGAKQDAGNNEALSVNELDSWLANVDLAAAFGAE